MEPFFHSMKVELVRQRRWAAAKRLGGISGYIDSYYNQKRIHLACSGISHPNAPTSRRMTGPEWTWHISSRAVLSRGCSEVAARRFIQGVVQAVLEVMLARPSAAGCGRQKRGQNRPLCIA